VLHAPVRKRLWLSARTGCDSLGRGGHADSCGRGMERPVMLRTGHVSGYCVDSVKDFGNF